MKIPRPASTRRDTMSSVARKAVLLATLDSAAEGGTIALSVPNREIVD